MFRTAYRLPFRLLGIPVHLDISFLLILPVLAWLIGRNIPLYIEIFELPIDPKELRQALSDLEPTWAELFPAEQKRVLTLLLERVEFDATEGEVAITFRPGAPRGLTR